MTRLEEKKKQYPPLKLVALFVAIAPLLAPYGVAGIRVNWILGIACVLYSFLRDRFALVVETKHYALLLFMAALTVFSINGLVILQTKNALINSLIMLFVVFWFYASAWRLTTFSYVIKYAIVIGWICVAFSFYQLVVTAAGGEASLGQLPFFNVETGWVEEHWGYRFNSLFSEPSYFALYLLPLFAYCYRHKKWLHAIVMLIGIVVSSSSLGIVGAIVIMLFEFLVSKRGRMRSVLMMVSLVLVLILLYLLFPAVQEMVGRTVEKLFKAEFGDLRLFGYFSMYRRYAPKELLFGVGMNQFKNYMGQQGVFVYNYSNTLVYMLLQNGLAGLLALLGYLAAVVKYSAKNKTVLFLIPFLLLLVLDYAVFSDRFYYLLYFVMYYKYKDSKRENDADESPVCNAKCT
ncbi:MAG: O-antigen ligase family protein [Clostridia bacterium]|nr:O-antigen ligase family protein [Clostridia bacterium]